MPREPKDPCFEVLSVVEDTRVVGRSTVRRTEVLACGHKLSYRCDPRTAPPEFRHCRHCAETYNNTKEAEHAHSE